MPFNQILGQENAVQILQAALTNQRLAHAYLFMGPEGVGKVLTAMTLAKALNCLSPPRPADSCERCPSCLKIISQNHADVISIGADGGLIKIDQIRQLQRRLSYRPLEGGRRACIIDPADQMNEAAANALLKTLEEPPPETHLFLITAKPYRLLPTILSRCQRVKFKPLSLGQVIQILKSGADLDEAQAHFYASLSGGSAARALDLSRQKNFEKRLDWLNLFSQLKDFSLEEILSRAEAMAKEKDEEAAVDGLELWKLWVRDLMVWKLRGPQGKEILINRDLAREAANEASQYSFGQLEDLFELFSRIQKAIAMKSNLQLALEAGLLEMKAVQGEKRHPSPFSLRESPGLAVG